MTYCDRHGATADVCFLCEEDDGELATLRSEVKRLRSIQARFRIEILDMSVARDRALAALARITRGQRDDVGDGVRSVLVDAANYLGAASTEAPGNLDALAASVATWQRDTFPTASLAGASAHLVQEANEVRLAVSEQETNIGEELADVFFLAVQCATLTGIDLAECVRLKLTKNKARTWPTKPDEDGVFNHVDEGDTDG